MMWEARLENQLTSLLCKTIYQIWTLGSLAGGSIRRNVPYQRPNIYADLERRALAAHYSAFLRNCHAALWLSFGDVWFFRGHP